MSLPLFTELSEAVRRVQSLFYLNAVIWLVFGAAAILRLNALHPNALGVMSELALLMFGNVLALLVGGMVLGKRKRWGYLSALLVLVANIVLAIADDFGYFDFIVLALATITLWFLLKLTPWYWQRL
ncbi:hypothetical protein GC175_08805 [bacterium]|nr:hypothetical protein [bacterium]